jgi:cobalt/nickel transport system permease protein
MNNDKYAYLISPIHRWNQTPKLVALLSLIFAFALVQKLILLPPMILVTAILYLLSKLPFSFLLDRLRYPGLFIAAVVILLPFVAGKTEILSWGFISLKKEGILAVLLIVTRFICMLTLTIVLWATAPFLTTLKSMRKLGLSEIIVDMMLLTYRYLEELKERLITMERSLKLRGFQPRNLTRRNLQVFASLMGTLFVGSYEQSKLVYQAMILRGYGYNHHQTKVQEKLSYHHWLACWLTIFIALIFVILELKLKTR